MYINQGAQSFPFLEEFSFLEKLPFFPYSRKSSPFPPFLIKNVLLSQFSKSTRSMLIIVLFITLTRGT